MKRVRWIGVAPLVVTSAVAVGLILFAGIGLTAVLAQGGTGTPLNGNGISVNSPEYEPNDTIWDSNGASLGYTWHAKIKPAGDVDFYRYYAYAGLPLTASVEIPAGSPLAPVLSLYNWNEELLAQATCAGSGICLEYLPVYDEEVFLKVEDAGSNGGTAFRYSVIVRGVDVYEPNDFAPQAAAMAYGEEKIATFNSNSDVDFFTFDGVEGDIIHLGGYTYVRLLDADENELPLEWANDGLTGTLPATGAYYLEVISDYNTDSVYRFRLMLVDQAVYLSLSTGGAVGGVPFTSGDILRHWTRAGTWEMFFDASDVGLKGNLVAFNFSYAPQLVYSKSQVVPGLGQVEPHDIIAFNASQFGEDTVGSLEWSFDGSDMGLTTAGEGIDALADEGYRDYLLLSTTGAAKVPYGPGQLGAKKTDILSFIGFDSGANTTGYWQPYRDGFTLDVGAANLSGLDYVNWDKLYVSFDRRVILDGIALDPGDIALCQLAWYMNGCESVEKYFDASDAGLGGYKVDAFDVSSPGFGYPYP